MFTVLAAAVALAAPVPKATAPELKWKFTKGDTFYVTATIDATSTINGGGVGGGVAVQGSTSASVCVYKATVMAADDKTTTVELEFLTCKTGNGVGGAAVKMDDQPGVAGKRVTFTLDPSHKVTKADGLANLGNAGGLFGGEYVQSQLQDLFRAVPGKALGKGETWKAEEQMPLADGIVSKRSDRGTVAGTEDGFTKLEVESDNAMTGGPKGGPTFDLKGDKGKRTILFDPKVGRVRKLEENYNVAGNIGLGNLGGGGGGGAPQNIELSMTMKTTMSVSDEQPKDEK